MIDQNNNISLLADIGGTFCRFSIIHDDISDLKDYKKIKCNDFDCLEDAIDWYLQEIKQQDIENIFFAIAAPIQGEIIKIVNNHWLVDRNKLINKFNLKYFKVINDFKSIAYAVIDIQEDDIESIFTIASNISNKSFNKINDYELATCVLKKKKGVQCIITNSRHCSFGYDQRVELFGSKGMIISGNKKQNETEIFTKKNTSQKKPLLNFFVERYIDAYKLQLDELALYANKKKKPISSFEDGRRALIVANTALNSLKQKKQLKIKF